MSRVTKKNTPKRAIPKRFQRFLKEYPEVGKAYSALSHAVQDAGPLDEKTRTLIKIGISAGSRQEGALHSHVRKALDAGATPEEIRHTILQCLPTIGFPGMMAAMSWADDILNG
ncbi:MAG TPA: carboxymuconolactone decarboxylase family protein [bacterium]|nr:carboxymuconolactone decarboxylase family protein [bacterium]